MPYTPLAKSQKGSSTDSPVESSDDAAVSNDAPTKSKSGKAAQLGPLDFAKLVRSSTMPSDETQVSEEAADTLSSANAENSASGIKGAFIVAASIVVGGTLIVA
jgi:hypothetical protein